MKKNLLILGGSGFLGKNLVEVLKGSYNIIIFDHKEIQADGILSYAGDFANAEDLEIVFKDNKIDLVMHLISTTTPGSSNNNIIFDISTNLIPSVKLLDLIKKYNIPKIVFISSGGAIYGKIGKEITSVSEDYPTDPLCSHAIGKLAIEKYIHLYNNLHGIDYLILRISNLYGEHHQSNTLGLINVSLKKILQGETIEIWGDGEIIRDYIYVNDCVRIIKMLLDKDVKNEIFNVGSGQGYSINQIVDKLKKSCGKFTVEYKPGRDFDVPRIVLNIEKLKEIVDFQFTNIDEGINNTYNWLKKI